jgi:hypothetical protein
MYRIHILFLFSAYAFFMLFFAVFQQLLHVIGSGKIYLFTAERGISSTAGRSGLQAQMAKGKQDAVTREIINWCKKTPPEVSVFDNQQARTSGSN